MLVKKTMWTVTAVLILILHLSTCELSDRIISGTISERGQFPFNALVVCKTKDGLAETCSGSLIRRNYVMSAAHCMCNHEKCKVVLGVVDKRDNKNAQIFVSSDLTVHPCYDDYNTNRSTYDLGLIKLPKDAKLTANVGLITLAESSTNSEKYVDTIATAVGWGVSKLQLPDDKHLTKQLRYLKLKILDKNECKDPPVFLDQELLCVIGVEKDQMECDGDSGGPVLLKHGNEYLQIGINEFVLRLPFNYTDQEGEMQEERLNCVDPTKPSAVLRISFHQEWIQATINNEKYNAGNCELRTVGRSEEHANNSSQANKSSGYLLKALLFLILARMFFLV